MRILGFLFALVLSLVGGAAYAQTGPPAPSPGVWAIIDTNYAVGASNVGHSYAKITLKNTTATKLTGVQFRVFYDKAAFASAAVSIIGPPANLYLQYQDNNASGYVTVTIVYTGNSPDWTLPNSELFLLDFTHVSSTSFQALTSISNLTWSGAFPYPQVAAAQAGTDVAMSLHNYGGKFLRPKLDYSGVFTNVSGTPAKSLYLSLEKKPKTSSGWTTHNTYVTDKDGRFAFSEVIDTTFWNVRLAVKGDTMKVGNVVSVADAQQVNQWVLGNVPLQSWDFYSGDVNGDGNITVSDVWSVFGRIAGRFNQWPNGVNDVRFFTAAEYAAITDQPGTNMSVEMAGNTNFYHEILPGQPNNVTFYVLVKGDANNTGYHMARMVPTESGYVGNSKISDQAVVYDFVTPFIEVNLPSVTVEEGNLVKLPVKLFTNGKKIGALQLAMKFDTELLEFSQVTNSEKAGNWMSFVNPNDGVVEWGGYDQTNGKNLFEDGETVFTLNFLAKKPQGEWSETPLYTSRKFVGDENSTDLSTTNPTAVYKVKSLSANELRTDEILVYPNPTKGEAVVKFNVSEDGDVSLGFVDVTGKRVLSVFNQYMPKGNYSYSVSLSDLAPGLYSTTLTTGKSISVSQLLLDK